MASGVFKPSTPWTSADSFYGNGWYFTDVRPNTPDSAIMTACWNLNNQPSWVRRYLEFDIDASILKNPRSGVYMLALNLIADGVINIRTNYTQGQKTVILFRNGGDR